MTIRVTSQRGSSGLAISTAGRYINLPTNGVAITEPRQPIQPTSSLKAFWQSVLVMVTTAINDLP